jgi:hypothetical protein
MNEQKKATNNQIYALLSAAPYSTVLCVMPREILNYIVLIGFKSDCYQNGKKYLENPDSILHYIANDLTQNISHRLIVATLKTCLFYNEYSLCHITNNYKHTVLHRLFYIKPNVDLLSMTEIFCRVAADNAWDLITFGDENSSTALHWASLLAHKNPALIATLLHHAPSKAELLTSVCSQNKFGMRPYQHCFSTIKDVLNHNKKDAQKESDEN